MVTAVAGEFVLRQFWASRRQPTYRTLAVERLKKGPVDVIFVGSSHIRSGINPACFPYSVINLADSGLDYQMAEVLCKKYWKQVSKAKMVVLELDPVPVYKNTLAIRKGDFRNFHEWGLHARELPLSSWETFKASVSEYSEVSRMGKIWPSLISPQRPFDSSLVGPGFKSQVHHVTSTTKVDFNELGTEFDQIEIDRNITCLRRLLLNLKKEGVNVKMLRPPYHQVYWENRKSNIRNRYAEIALNTFLKTPGVTGADVIDMRYESQAIDEFFSDWTHLSAQGAKHLSELLARIIDLEKL